MNTYESNSKELNKTNLISIINYERIRYKRKGYGFLGAIFITIFFFLYLPIIFNKVYQNFFYFKFNEGLYFFTFIMIYDKILLYSFLIIYWLIYRSKLNFFERYKVNDNPWPWEKDRFEWDKMLKSCLKFHIINKYLVVTIINIPSMIEGNCYVELSSDNVPEVFDVFWQICIFIIVEDFFFYWLHRLWHHKSIYPYIHKIHHRFIDTVVLANNYEHPLEFLGNIFASSFPLLIFKKKIHLITYCLWLIIRTGEALDKHSGYEFSWSPFNLIPFSGSAEFHTYHHTNTKGNYGSFLVFWDRVGKTFIKNYIQKLEDKKIL